MILIRKRLVLQAKDVTTTEAGTFGRFEGHLGPGDFLGVRPIAGSDSHELIIYHKKEYQA